MLLANANHARQGCGGMDEGFDLVISPQRSEVVGGTIHCAKSFKYFFTNFQNKCTHGHLNMSRGWARVC